MYFSCAVTENLTRTTISLSTHALCQNQGLEQYVKCADAWAPTAATNEWPPPPTSLSSSTVPGSGRLFPAHRVSSSRVTTLLLILGVPACPSLCPLVACGF